MERNMNEIIENRIIELIDAGKTAENSSELRDIIESSDEAKQFYYNFLKFLHFLHFLVGILLFLTRILNINYKSTWKI